jgi:hypothetical protein
MWLVLVRVWDCVNLCLLLDNNLCLLLDNNLCRLLDNNLCLLLDYNICLPLDNNICLWCDYVFCWTLPSVDIFYLIGILGSSTFNFHEVNRMLITCESSVGAFLHLTLLYLYLWYYNMHIIIYCTCWVPTLSVLNLAISPCSTNLLLRSWMRFWDSLMRSSRRAITPGRWVVGENSKVEYTYG